MLCLDVCCVWMNAVFGCMLCLDECCVWMYAGILRTTVYTLWGIKAKGIPTNFIDHSVKIAHTLSRTPALIRPRDEETIVQNSCLINRISVNFST